MDTLQFKEAFVSEAQDQFDILNQLLVVLEKNPSDTDTINKVFRVFHTLKGNAATLGFEKFSDLAHALEDILSGIRDSKVILTPEVMDLLLKGCDALETGLVEITNDTPENIDTETIIQELKKKLGATPVSFTVRIGTEAALTDNDREEIKKLEQQHFAIFRIILAFDPTNKLKAAKAGIVLRNLSDECTIIKTTPSREDIKQKKFNTEVEVVVATKKTKQEVDAIVHKITGLKHAFLLNLNEQYEKPSEIVHQDKERAKAKITTQHQQEAAKQIQSVKVNMHKLDKMMNLVGELLISNIRIQEMRKHSEDQNFKAVAEEVDRLTLELQDEVMGVRMVPIGNIFKRFPRMVRDLAKREGKKINLTIEGDEIEFDRTVLEEIGDPLIHLLRNSVDHGIEAPTKRIEKGKQEEGTIQLIARREKNNAVIEVSDDGIGIDPSMVRESSIKKGLITTEEATKMTNKQLQMLIFKAGVSTKDVVTEVSGRGVGMDVVLNKVKEIGGELSLYSVQDKGTKIIMQLPLTVAIVTALLVKANKETLVIPLALVDETIDITPAQIKTIQGNRVFIWRDVEIPLFWLSELIGCQIHEKARLTVVLVNKDNNLIGLVVDEIISQQQVLIKGLQQMIKGTKGIAGATILGDGTVALILDMRTLL